MLIPIAATDVGIALVGAGGALLGAIVGVLGAGGVDLMMQRRRERAAAKAAARVLRVDLSVARGQIGEAIADLEWWPFYAMPLPTWDRDRDTLAVVLATEAWGITAQSVIELRHISRNMMEAPLPGGQWPRTISPVAAVSLTQLYSNATAAFNALGDIADDDERLTDDDVPEPGSGIAS